jgi:hypothetical protein
MVHGGIIMFDIGTLKNLTDNFKDIVVKKRIGFYTGTIYSDEDIVEGRLFNGECTNLYDEDDPIFSNEELLEKEREKLHSFCLDDCLACIGEFI